METEFASGFFIPPELCNGVQLAFLTAVYGYVLCMGSGMISDGSELLLLVPSIAGMVGSVVLPVLGCVPDSLMVLFSGLGSNPEMKVSVGVGALAGSTIMLLTVPWFLSVYGGRVNLDPRSGAAIYYKAEKLTPPNFFHWTRTGVANSGQVMRNAVFMMGSALLYLIIQIPASIAPADSPIVALAALSGFVTCFLTWIYYIYRQYLAGQASNSVVDEMVTDARVEAIRNREMTLMGAMQSLVTQPELQQSLGRPLLEIAPSVVRQLRATLHRFFRVYEDQSENGKIGFEEFKVIPLSPKELLRSTCDGKTGVRNLSCGNWRLPLRTTWLPGLTGLGLPRFSLAGGLMR